MAAWAGTPYPLGVTSSILVSKQRSNDCYGHRNAQAGLLENHHIVGEGDEDLAHGNIRAGARPIALCEEA